MAQAAIAVWAEGVLGGYIQPQADGSINFYFKVVARDTASPSNPALLLEPVVANTAADATASAFITAATTAVVNACAANGLTAVARTSVRLPAFQAGA